MSAQDHLRLKWIFSYIQAKYTPPGLIIFTMILPAMSIASIGTTMPGYLVVSMILSLWCTANILAFFFAPNVTLTVTRPLSPTAGGKIDLSVTITNQGRRHLRNIALFTRRLPHCLYNAPDPDGKTFVPWLKPNEQVTVMLPLNIPRRGSFVIPPLLAGCSFPSGLARSLRRKGGPTRLTVLPKLTKIDHPSLLPRHPAIIDGYSSASATRGSHEFLSTRDFRDGDRPKDIHWASSARACRLVVKEYANENSLKVGLLIDTQLGRFEKHRCFEGRISACAGLAEGYFQQHVAVELFSTDTNVPFEVFPGGRLGFEQFLESLAMIEDNEHASFGPVLERIKEHRHHLAMMVLFLNSIDPKRTAFIKSLKELDIDVKTIVLHEQPEKLNTAAKDILVFSPKQIGFTL